MAISIQDAIQTASVLRTNPFAAGTMLIDPSSAGVTNFTNFQSSIDQYANMPGVDILTSGSLDSLSSTIGFYTSGISNSMAMRMGTISADMSAISNFIDLFDVGQPCNMILGAFGSLAVIDEMMSEALAKIKSIVEPVLAAIEAGLQYVVSAIHDAIQYIQNKLAEFTDMIADELNKLGHMLLDNIDLSFLDDLKNLSICAEHIMGVVSTVAPI